MLKTQLDRPIRSSLLLLEKIYGETAIAFRDFRPLGIRNEYSFRGHLPTARTLACLRFADLVTETVARLTTGSGSTRRLRLLPPAGRDLHPLDDVRNFMKSSHPPIPIGQQGSVAQGFQAAFSAPPVSSLLTTTLRMRYIRSVSGFDVASQGFSKGASCPIPERHEKTSVGI